MKKVLGLSLVTLLASAVMASATATNWVITVTATGAADGTAGACKIGAKTGYVDGQDVIEASHQPASPSPGQSLSTATFWTSSTTSGTWDYKAPMTGPTDVKTFYGSVYYQTSGGAAVPTITVNFAGSTTSAIDYANAGKVTIYAPNAIGTTKTWVFDSASQLSATGVDLFQLAGKTSYSYASPDFIVTVGVPEPGSMLALGSGLVGLIGFGIRRRK